MVSHSAGPNARDAPIGYAEDAYWNSSSAPLTIESVSLIDPHNLVLHGSVLYRMPHDLHPLPMIVRYKAGGRSYPAEARTGMGIGTSLDPARSCDAQMNAIQAAFAAGN